MAQTKRKRRTKHRGNAAGTVEVRGRTGRPPSPDERKKQTREMARQARLNTPPTWRGSFNRALLASGFMFVLLLVTSKFKIVPSVIFAILAMAIYVPSGFYLESFLYRRRMAKRAQQARPK
jgi:Flp pilus assembly protein TadB